VANRAGFGIVVALAVLLAVGGAGLALAQEQSPPHENPEEVDDDSDPAALQRWFGSRMGEIHVDCSEGLAVGNYDACEALDSEYDSYLERYVDVERETTRNESRRQGEEFDETRNEQQRLARELRAFEETRREYEAAKGSGDEGRTRRLAREMGRRAERIDRIGDNVSSGFRELDGSTSADLGSAANQTDATVAEVVRTAAEAETASLTVTEVAVETDDVASFASPATVSGLVRTDDWSAVSVGRVVVRDDAGFRENATLDEDGRWSLSYRPRRTTTGRTTLSVAYVPDAESPYMGANATRNLTVEATNATVDLESVTDEAAYGENVTAVGRLSAAEDYPADAPVTLSVDGTVVGTGRTDADGRFEVAGRLPAAVPAGNVTVGVQGGKTGTALAPGSESEALAVGSTATELTAGAEYDDDRARLSGRLRTADGDPVAGQAVTVSLAGESRSVRTNEQGYYSVVVDRPSARETADVRYAPAGSNLEESRATVPVEPYSAGRFGGIGDVLGAGGLPGPVEALWSTVTDHPLLAGFLVVAVAVAVVVWLLVGRQYLRRRRRAGATEGVGDGDLEPAVRRVTDDASGLAAARRQLEGAPSTAVQLAFATVRSGLGIDDSRTHWEVYRAASEGLDGERRAALQAVTEAFEAATFAPEGIDREGARRALEAAERCLSATDGGDRDGD
jgi:hypothetical protein